MNKVDWVVKPIPNDYTKEWMLKKHYAHRRPSVSFAYGLFDKSSLLQGICTFGNAIPMQMKRGVCGIEYQDIVYELNRLCLNEPLPKNCASFLVSQSLKQLPKPKIIVSYSDMAQFHHGYIYQATNFIYVGISHIQMDVKIRGKEHLHSRTIMDEFAFTKNRVKLLKEKYGDNLYYEQRPPKHKYIYFVGNRKQIRGMRKNLKYQILPYPKGNNKRYECCNISAQKDLMSM